ncbi:homoserine O-acetyltransferase MetX [Homoserinibacter sp. YIM 151385]|uniref:homoserine O-acetyltransferase MetX n=1 Tax=Homoserinibacter sp. YIM 151385 TaxID=2985506 RepID=UPI0022F01F31|nr:homoserine O-acetyltransferase [Homoserinibacter sp. YIM 151385]WBU38244.1 homoserine O-acetyltransferase [Homoserinibacter sp. YIM 151385]
MDWQTPEDAMPSAFVTEAERRSLSALPPASGAWRVGDDPGDRRFQGIGALELEAGGALPHVTIAYETWGELNEARDNAILLLHALTGDSHVIGRAGAGHATAGWWSGVLGEGLAIDTSRWFVIAPNMLGGCQGTTGPSSFAPDGAEWGSRFPFLTIRDQIRAQAAFADALGIASWAAVIGGSMGGMQALEWAATFPDRVERLAVLAAPALSGADQIALDSVQIEAIRMDPAFAGGDYYEAPDGQGPHRGLALARRMALLNYRSPTELDERFGRNWQSGIDPLGDGGVFAVESYLGFHGNKFTRRFDANSYLTLVHAMDSHDVGRDRGGVAAALSRVTARALVLGVDSDRLYPLEGQREIARHLAGNIDGDRAVEISSPFGHDAFLIEHEAVGRELARLLSA